MPLSKTKVVIRMVSDRDVATCLAAVAGIGSWAIVGSYLTTCSGPPPTRAHLRN